MSALPNRISGGSSTTRVTADARDQQYRAQRRAAAARVITTRLDDEAAAKVLEALGLDGDEPQSPRRCGHCGAVLVGGKPSRRYCSRDCVTASQRRKEPADA